MPPTASWARRFLALFVDWAASSLVTLVIVGPARYAEVGGAAQWVVFLVFLVESAVFMTLAGGSFGQLATRLRVVRWDGQPRPVALPRALLRQALILLVIPPLVFRPDGRGLHDLVAGTGTVTLESLRAGGSAT